MIAEILTAALPTLVSSLTEQFFAKRRDSVDVRELQGQVAELTAAQNSLQGELAEIEHVVLILTRYLALAHRDTFVLTGERLVLTEPFRSERESSVTPVMIDFGERVTHSIQKRQSHVIESFRRRQATTGGEQPEVPPSLLTIPPKPAQSPPDFLDSFAEEVLDLRLGRE